MSYVNGAAGWGDEAPHPANDATQGQSHHIPEGSKIQQPRGFRKAVKFDAKARVALIGVSGSGKSYTMLTLARALAGPAGKIACVDTEHGSLSKYADLFQFDVAEPDSYNPEYLLEQLDFAEQNGYAVFCVDSLSHFWMGKDGALEFVDNARKRTRDQFEGW
jgi:ABC-type cobalamin/Fe3+-siderophores transport system ATPase subunit